jgi:hypothetical protein
MNHDNLVNIFNYYLWYYKQSLKEYQENEKCLADLEKEILKLVLEKNYTLIDNMDYNSIKKNNNELLKNLSGFSKILKIFTENIREINDFNIINN